MIIMKYGKPITKLQGNMKNGLYGSIWRSWDDWRSGSNVCILSGSDVKQSVCSTGDTIRFKDREQRTI